MSPAAQSTDQEPSTKNKGLRSTRMSDRYDLVIVGGGVAGLTAALTSARAGRKTVLTGPYSAAS